MLILIPLLLVAGGGCSQANRAADNAHQLAWSKTDAVVLNLWNEARQLAVDKYAEQARLAAAAGDAGAAEAAVLGAIDTIDRLTYESRYNYQRARWVGSLARLYILSERNFFTLIYEQYLEAKGIVESEAQPQPDSPSDAG